MIFVDTGAWYASAVPDDDDHPAARNWLDGNTLPLLTTDYVIDETLTLPRCGDTLLSRWNWERRCLPANLRTLS
jgi:predicted nucleic acid-binding protein